MISAAGVTGTQNGGEGEHRRCGRRVNIESEDLEKNQTAEEREEVGRERNSPSGKKLEHE